MKVSELIAILNELPPDFTVGQLTPYGNLTVDTGDVRVSAVGVAFDAEGWGFGLDEFKTIKQQLEEHPDG